MGGRAPTAIELKLLLDEMHAPEIANRLRDRGHDAVAVKECPDLVGLPDEDLLVAAQLQTRVLVTEDIKDFLAGESWCATTVGWMCYILCSWLTRFRFALLLRTVRRYLALAANQRKRSVLHCGSLNTLWLKSSFVVKRPLSLRILWNNVKALPSRRSWVMPGTCPSEPRGDLPAASATCVGS